MVPFAALALPIVVLVFGGWLMLEVSGRNKVMVMASALGPPLPKSLASRPGGYDEKEADDYWKKLGEDGRRAELSFLKIDFLFAIFYIAALAFSIVTVRAAYDFEISPALLLVPVVIALAADWTETAIHFRHLVGEVIKSPQSISPAAIKIASFATITKLVSVLVSYLIPVAMIIIGEIRDRQR